MSFTKIFTSKHQEIYFDEEKSIIKNIWLTELIDFEEMKHTL